MGYDIKTGTYKLLKLFLKLHPKFKCEVKEVKRESGFFLTTV